MNAGPPTIRSTRAIGITVLDAHCLMLNRYNHRGCGHVGAILFDALRLPDDTVFLDIPWRRRLICSRCGTRSYEISADWRGYYAHYDARFLDPFVVRTRKPR